MLEDPHVTLHIYSPSFPKGIPSAMLTKAISNQAGIIWRRAFVCAGFAWIASTITVVGVWWSGLADNDSDMRYVQIWNDSLCDMMCFYVCQRSLSSFLAD